MKGRAIPPRLHSGVSGVYGGAALSFHLVHSTRSFRDGARDGSLRLVRALFCDGGVGVGLGASSLGVRIGRHHGFGYGAGDHGLSLGGAAVSGSGGGARVGNTSFGFGAAAIRFCDGVRDCGGGGGAASVGFAADFVRRRRRRRIEFRVSRSHSGRHRRLSITRSLVMCLHASLRHRPLGFCLRLGARAMRGVGERRAKGGNLSVVRAPLSLSRLSQRSQRVNGLSSLLLRLGNSRGGLPPVTLESRSHLFAQRQFLA